MVVVGNSPPTTLFQVGGILFTQTLENCLGRLLEWQTKSCSLVGPIYSGSEPSVPREGTRAPPFLFRGLFALELLLLLGAKKHQDTIPVCWGGMSGFGPSVFHLRIPEGLTKKKLPFWGRLQATW